MDDKEAEILRNETLPHDQKQGYFREDGKTWYQSTNEIIYREHDDNFWGRSFRHKRCPFCQRITCIHILHWLNHLCACAPKRYHTYDLGRLRHSTLEDVERYKHTYSDRE